MFPYKDDNPTVNFPYVTVGLIVINVIIFALQLTGNETMYYRYGAVPAALLGHNAPPQGAPAGMTLLTSMFMHAGLMHLGGNMLYLWIFGNNIEDRMGPVKFTIFYIVGGIVAAYAHALSSGATLIPVVGASGAVSAVLGAYILLYPKAHVHTLVVLGFYITSIKLPALIVIGVWAIIQVANSLPSVGASGSSVAWFAHLGGFFYGMAAVYLFINRNKLQEA